MNDNARGGALRCRTSPALAPISLLLSLSLGLTAAAHAQVVPDSGQLLREVPAQRPPAPPAPPRIQVAPEPGRAATATGPTLVLRSLSFEVDAPGVDLPALERAAAPSIGQSLDLAGLYALADRLARQVREQGFPLAQVLLPAQQVEQGQVRLLVRVGRLDRQAPGGGVRVDNRAPRLKDDIVRATVTQALQAPGDALRLEDLERGLRRLNDLPGVNAVASLERGSAPGTTQVAVQVDEGPLWAAAVLADNAGNRYTGAGRVTAQVSLLDPTGRGDAASLQATAAEHSRSLVLQYGLPLGTTGWRGNVTLSGLRYELAGPLARLDAQGSARSAGVSVQGALLRTNERELSLLFTLDRRHMADDSLGQPVARKHSLVLGGTVLASQSDRWLGGGFTQGSAGVVSGHLDLNDEPASAALDGLGPQANGGFRKLVFGVSRLQQLAPASALFASLRGQWTDGNLDSSEKLQLGGAGAVRAYPSGEGSVDSGFVFTAELRQDLRIERLSGVLQGVLFVDSARGQQHQSPWRGWDASSPGLVNGVNLAGAGVGMNLLRGPMSARVAYAWRLGHNPLAGPGGVDADGRHRPGRLWLQASFEL